MLTAKKITPFLILAFFVSLNAAAGPVFYNSFGKYTVTIDDSSTILNGVPGSNGATTGFSGFGSTYVGGGPTAGTSGSFQATFQADAGYIFNAVDFGTSQWSFGLPEGGWLYFFADWQLPGATYTGSNFTSPLYGSWPSGTQWSSDGDSGQYAQYWSGNQGGGGQSFLKLYEYGSNLLLDNVSSFTLSFQMSIFHGGNVFGSNTGAGFGFSSMDVFAQTVAGEPAAPPVSSVPEPALPMLLLSALAILIRRRTLR